MTRAFNYELHTNLTDHHEILEKLKAFAENEGWTIDHYHVNKEWVDTGGGVYGFQTDTNYENFLQITGNPDNTNLECTFRFRSTTLNTGTIDPYIGVSAQSSVTKPLDTSSSSHPASALLAGMSSYKYWHSVYDGAQASTWIIGDDRFLAVVMKCDNTFYQIISVGEIDCFDNSFDSGGFIGSTLHLDWWYQWYDYTVWFAPFGTNANNIIVGGTDVKAAVYSTNLFETTNSGYPFNEYNIVNYDNLGGGVKGMVRPIIYVKDVADSAPRPIGQLPVFFLNGSGLFAGQVLDRGSEKYIVFPSCQLALKQWWAMRVL